MNREILFRGKTVPTQDCESEWIVGDLLSNAYPIPNIRPLGSICCYQVIPSTVGQYTGLTDRNGVKIFEGDIVACDGYDGYGEIKWCEYTARFIIEHDEFIADFDNFDDMDCEVISNIHDNPELLGGEE